MVKKSKKKLPIKKILKVVKKKAKPRNIIVRKISKSKPAKIKRKIASSLKTENPFPAQTFFKAKIKVIGIGGGGGSIVSEIGRSLGKATFVVADTDARAFKKRAGIKQFLFGHSLTHGLGTGVNPELGRQAAEQEKEKLAHFFHEQDIVIFIASLGGGLGSGATQVFAEAAKDFNGITFGIFTLPFKFEGKQKYKIASKALRELRKSLNVSITIPNEKIFKVIDANTAITDAFSLVNKSLIESLESLIDLIYNPGIINIDFADLQAILKGKGNMAFLNTKEASGKHRADEIAETILHNPLYQNNGFTTEKILFNVAGGGNLSMFEVDKISRAVSSVNPNAKIIFGISKDTKLKNKIKTTLLMTGSALGEKRAAPEPSKEPVKPEKNAKRVKAKVVVEKSKKPVVKKPKKEKAPSLENLVPVFHKLPVMGRMEAMAVKNAAIQPPEKPKQAIRRTALEVKAAETLEENKQSLQEKEWEIPAFMRIKK